jgi:hypothetical protein
MTLQLLTLGTLRSIRLGDIGDQTKVADTLDFEILRKNAGVHSWDVLV